MNPMTKEEMNEVSEIEFEFAGDGSLKSLPWFFLKVKEDSIDSNIMAVMRRLSEKSGSSDEDHHKV